jgi:hypothetical protein
MDKAFDCVIVVIVIHFDSKRRIALELGQRKSRFAILRYLKLCWKRCMEKTHL